ASAHVELAVDVREVELHRLLGEPKRAGDLLVRLPLGKRLQDRHLAFGEASLFDDRVDTLLGDADRLGHGLANSLAERVGRGGGARVEPQRVVLREQALEARHAFSSERAAGVTALSLPGRSDIPRTRESTESANRRTGAAAYAPVPGTRGRPRRRRATAP